MFWEDISSHREVFDKLLGLVAQLSIEDELPAPLQQQQLIKGLKDVDAGLVDGAHNGPACVDDVTHCSHDNGCSSSIQSYMHKGPLVTVRHSKRKFYVLPMWM